MTPFLVPFFEIFISVYPFMSKNPHKSLPKNYNILEKRINNTYYLALFHGIPYKAFSSKSNSITL